MSVGSILLQFDVGLDLIEDDATLTFIFFLGVSLLGALGLRFSYYANQNMRQSRIETQREIWFYLQFIGAIGALYALIWVVEITTSLAFEPRNAVWLLMMLFLVLSLRQISITAGARLSDQLGQFDQLLRLVCIGLVVVYSLVVLIVGLGTFGAVLEGLAGLLFLGYGYAYFRRQISRTRLQGTMLDSLVRHLIPVLTFGTLLNIVALAVAVGADRTVVLHVQLVFLIMTATALMTATIKLRQNLAGL